MSEMIRLQIEIDENQLKELERLQELTGLRTRKDLVNNALSLLKWAIKERARGCSIVSVNEEKKTFVELAMPCLDNVVPNTGVNDRSPMTTQRK